ncbi:hypothetical protein G9A89_003774 [Geosiphon pyriformis]|nr:hypothetical protein G9A89_003774 [Geosiphon pyriformis]
MSFSVFRFHVEVSFGAVFEWFEVDRLLVTGVDILWMAAVNILLVVAVDKLGSNILVLDKLAVVSLADKCFDFALDFDIDLGFGIGDRGFDVNFPIVNYKHCSWLLCGLVYHNCGRHTSLAATADWPMLRNALDFGNDLVVAEVVLVAVGFADSVVEVAAKWVQLLDQLVGD